MEGEQVGIWLWDDANSVWLPAPACVVTIRMAAAGQVIAGAHKLYWLVTNPGAASSVLELTDAIAALGAVVFDHFDTTRDGHVMSLNPPMCFATGIYLETFTNMTSIIFGYV